MPTRDDERQDQRNELLEFVAELAERQKDARDDAAERIGTPSGDERQESRQELHELAAELRESLEDARADLAERLAPMLDPKGKP